MSFMSSFLRLDRALAAAIRAPRWRSAEDAGRARYVQMNFGQDWRDPHLYDLMISSKPGEELAASTILCGMGRPI